MNEPETPIEGKLESTVAVRKDPLLFKEDSLRGESRAMNISLRGWIALAIVVTLCFLVVWIVLHLPVPDNFDKGAAFVKDLFVPVVMAVIACYFATKPNNPNPPTSPPAIPPAS
jgi:hypothetical protein